jgi:pilus assembly protein CpaC
MRLRANLLRALAIAALSFAAPSAAVAAGRDEGVVQNGETITLAIGETKIVSARDIRNYSEGVAGIIDIKLTADASQFVIAGKKPGSTTLLLIKNDGTQITLNIDVFLRSPVVVERELSQLLEGLAGVQVRRVGAHIVIDGTVATEGDLKRVQHVASLYPNQVDSLVQLAWGGVVGSGTEPQRYIIRIDFYFVQYDIDSTYTVGLGWPASIGAAASVNSTFTYNFLDGVPTTATATLANQPLPRLDLASTRGWAKVLKQATVLTNNGVEAMFQNGTEQNFTVTTGIGVGLQRIIYGTEITVTPRYSAAQREIEVRVQADVSDLTSSIAGTPLPGRNTSKLLTSVSLKLGQSLVLSGIRRESTTHTITGVPVLKDIPVLGVLFGSHSDDTQGTEGAVIIVPSVIETIPTATQEMISASIAKFRDFRGDLSRVNAFEKKPGGGGGVPPSPKP